MLSQRGEYASQRITVLMGRARQHSLSLHHGHSTCYG